MHKCWVFNFTTESLSFYLFTYCSIDASKEDGTIGRLVNDDRRPNSKMVKIVINNVPRLCLFAIRNIGAGEEITYNYGGVDLPWRRHSKVVYF